MRSKWQRGSVALGALAVLIAILVMPVAKGAAAGETCTVSAADAAADDALVARFWQLGVFTGHGTLLKGSVLDTPLTRAEFATVLVRILGWEKQAKDAQAEGLFSDLNGHWAAGYVVVLAREGIVRGDPNGAFRPNDRITPAEAELMVARTLRAGPDLTLANAESALRNIGMATELPCPNPDAFSYRQMLTLLDRAMHLSILDRLPNR